VHPKHPKKEINDALDYADQLGFVIEQTAAGHKWGRIVQSHVLGLVDTKDPVQPWPTDPKMG
jgi:hypothetical protein